MFLGLLLSLIIPLSSLVLLLYTSALSRSRKLISVVLAVVLGILLTVTGRTSADDTQFYADDGSLPNDGVDADAAPL